MDNIAKYFYLIFVKNDFRWEMILESIFDSFVTSGKPSGTGLGLPFCKMVMQAFNGDIICQSENGKGAEFILKF
jgi:two-component system, CAI-1 autoinducer sensor kinase/phosphatase CqsS